MISFCVIIRIFNALKAWRTQVSTRLKRLCPLLLAPILWTTGVPLYAATPSETDKSVRAIVSGIISYTRWPASLTTPPRLCIFSSSRYVGVLRSGDIGPTPWQAVVVSTEQQALGASCDAIYFGNESAEEQQKIIQRYQPRALLSIAEQNSQCIVGSAFCLSINSERVKFSVNLDALSRSGVRVNPDVLMLARNKKHE
ncbi:YfiR family protein [Pluralibacter sp.]|uniref:YfiR family protein n=1 Tax=Pluralibacter sp. TaxID=1920032 RepID=UPI0025CE1471|nr:YfiR family protein [Pluralibacter sp.]MBV8043622.1 YfiR family protein [Pluralibacter sp.]